MNIAVLSYHTCPLATLGGKDTGGMNVYVRDLTCVLGRKGIHADVFTRSQDEHVPHVLHDLGFGNRVVHIQAGPEIPMQKKELVGYIPEYVDGIQQFSQEKGIRYDLIHSHYWMSGVAASHLAKRWGGTPILQMFHTLGEMKNRVAKKTEDREGAYRLEGEKQVIQAADRIIAATLAEQAQLQWLYKADTGKISVIPPGVDTDHFYPIPVDEARQYIGLKPKDRMILFVGRIEPLKGLDTLIHAISILRFTESAGPVHLAIIGGDPDLSSESVDAEMTRVQRLCDDLCMGKMVVFLGRRGQDTLPYYYSAAEVVVMPSHYESFGMVALEAMACGTPVIASQVGGLGFLVQDGQTGYTIPAEDPGTLAEKLTALLEDHDLRQSMGQNAYQYAQGYDWRLIAEKIIVVYETLIKKPVDPSIID
jgi:D-inositol-3-phosphate glycosyltransferase